MDEYRAVIKRLDEILLDPSKAVPPGGPVREKKKAPAPSATVAAEACAAGGGREQGLGATGGAPARGRTRVYSRGLGRAVV